MPKLSIITINYNNAAGLEKTMHSVLSQKGITSDAVEYLVIDGNSSDGSVDVIKTYESDASFPFKITSWVSEPDSGIYNAMNKGTRLATGEFCLYLNSGDYLHDDSVIADVLPLLTEPVVYYGIEKMVTEPPYDWRVAEDRLTFEYFTDTTIPHESAFIPKNLILQAGGYNEGFKIISDWALFLDIRCRLNTPFKLIERIITDFDCTGISANPEFTARKEAAKRKYLEENYKPFLDVVDKYHRFDFSDYCGTELVAGYRKIRKLIIARLLKRIFR